MGRILTGVSKSISSALFGYGGKKIFTSSGIFVSSVTGTIRVQCLGGGGSGSIAYYGNSGSFPSEYCRGGGGGGFSVKEIGVSKGDTFTVIVGAGGSAVGNPGVAVRANGNAGGATSFGSVISATGGLGGVAAINNSSVSALGGIGVGGDQNYTGGSGGVFVVGISGATGGGAAATMYGDGGNGGDIVAGSGSKFASGGGGVASANAPSLTGFGSPHVSGVGAGTGGVGDSGRYDGYPAAYTESILIARQLVTPIYPLDGIGGSSGKWAGPGGGGYGQVLTSNVTQYGNGGICGGGGGCVCDFDVASMGYVSGVGGKYGGGSGAILILSPTTGPMVSAGGSGLVIVEW